MRPTEPRVRLVAAPAIRWAEVHEYLKDLGGLRWWHRMQAGESSDGEALVELAGRSCYRSWDVGLNANVRQVREDSAAYMANVLASKHGSVLEHAQFTFIFQDVSRVFTHELVRHRAGVAISQESLRFVRLTDIGFRIPDVLAHGPAIVVAGGDGEADTVPMRTAIVSLVETLEEFQVAAAEAFGLDEDGVPFAYKKEVTSALRRLAPLGLSTTMVWSANIRTLRHVIEMRTAASAEEEIRLVFDAVARTMKRECSMLFGDFTPQAVDEANLEVPAWVPTWSKV